MVGPAVHLEVVAGNATGMSILVDDELVIGRHAEGAGRLADDEEISRAHARVTVDERGLCEIEDLGSTNGTFVNALRISAPHQLSKGDTIELGATTLVVRELPTAEPEDAPGEPPSALQPTVAGTAVPRVEPPPAEAPAPEPPVEAPASEPPAEAPAPEPAAPLPPEPGDELATQPYEPADEPPLRADPEPEPLTPPDEPVPVPPPLRIALEIDFASRAATIELDGEVLRVQLVFDSGRWQLATPPD